MKLATFGLAIALVSISTGNAQDSASPESKPLESPAADGKFAVVAPQWGDFVNPSGDCKVERVNGGTGKAGSGVGGMKITVPSGDPGHDLAAELNVMNSPRLVQRVEGDFRVTVAVEGKFMPGAQSSIANRTGYNGAGLLLFADEKNYASLHRATLDGGDGPVGYANFEQRVGGENQRLGETADYTFDPNIPVLYLRLERRGSRLKAAASQDGSRWTDLGSKELPPAFGHLAQVGVLAVSTSAVEFSPIFRDLRVEKLSLAETRQGDSLVGGVAPLAKNVRRGLKDHVTSKEPEASEGSPIPGADPIGPVVHTDHIGNFTGELDTGKLMTPKRWPVQILSAIYGTGGKNADVTAKVKEYVETLQRKFSANPVDLGADPNPFWNKSLHVIYMKDGVRREQRRNENETILPESFYGPQDAGELKSWLSETRWKSETSEIQFHPDATFTSPGVEGVHQWEVGSEKKLRLVWADKRVAEFKFDFTWSSFLEIENGKNVFHLLNVAATAQSPVLVGFEKAKPFESIDAIGAVVPASVRMKNKDEWNVVGVEEANDAVVARAQNQPATLQLKVQVFQAYKEDGWSYRMMAPDSTVTINGTEIFCRIWVYFRADQVHALANVHTGSELVLSGTLGRADVRMYDGQPGLCLDLYDAKVVAETSENAREP